MRERFLLSSFVFIVATACVKSTPQKVETQDATPATTTTTSTIAPTWSDAGEEKTTGGRPSVPFSCDAVTFHRGWRFKGESSIIPSDVAELAAFHVTTRVTEGIAFRLEAGGQVLDTSLQFVRADAKGMPVDRFYESTSAWRGPIDVVAVGALPKGTTKLTLTLRDRTIGSDKRCVHQIDLGDGPVWPPMPRYAVTRYAVTKAKTLLLLYRADNVLLEETSAPTLYWKPDGGPVTRDGVSVQEIRSGLPRAMVTTNDKGEPAKPDPKAKSRFVVAEYEWRDTGTKIANEPSDLPNAFTAGDRLAPLPPVTPWTVPKELNDALNEAMRVSSEYGSVGAAVFLHGGRAELDRRVDAGTLSRF